MNFILGFLKSLKLPVKLLKRKQRVKRDEEEKKLRKYLRNSSAGRLKNRSWRKSDRRGGKTKFQWSKKRKSKGKKVNNSKG